jgi:hypothetical protein
MERRQILKYVAAVTGTAICAPLTGALLSGCDKPVKSSQGPIAPLGKDGQFFDAKALQDLSRIMDVILPKTSTPSASDVNVHLIMDNMFAKVFKPDYQQGFLTNFKALNDWLVTQGFAAATTSDQIKLLMQLEQSKQPKAASMAYLDIKQQTIAYYLSTEEIAEKHLNYLPIPGGYTPHISVQEVGGKAWAE